MNETRLQSTFAFRLHSHQDPHTIAACQRRKDLLAPTVEAWFSQVLACRFTDLRDRTRNVSETSIMDHRVHGGKRCVREDEEVESERLCVLIIEDDEYQTLALTWLLETAARSAGVMVDIKTVVDGQSALEECQQRRPTVDMVLMDHILLGDNGAPSRAASSHLPLIRAELGMTATIVMLSTSDQEVELVRCLDLGADAYHVKPIASTTVSGLLAYTREKRAFLRKRRRLIDDCADMPLGFSASPVGSPVITRRAHGDAPAADEVAAASEDGASSTQCRKFNMLEQGTSAFAHGRRSPVHLGMWTSNAKALGLNASDVATVHGGPLAMVAVKV